GSDWLAAWLEAPVWHFALGAGVAGPARCFGVLIPSVDRVGRHFPFTILGLAQPGGVALPHWALRAEALALSALDDGFDPDRLEEELALLGAPGDPGPDPVGDLEDWLVAANPVVAALAPGETLWRCRGTARVPAALLRRQGLPDADAAASLVAGPLTSSRPGTKPVDEATPLIQP
ncbi:MAG: type VI secretion system-associated protein TagF, partial [Acetobacteraceae bacterium]|nr:type VI secretion system-associated protein TagF [Acetobacteraceae bacterium]